MPKSTKQSGQNWSREWSVGIRVWVERQGATVLEQRSADLLIVLERTKSISAAARELGISYRHAWLLIQEANTAAGRPLTETAVGGERGGGAQLTDYGRAALAVFEQLQENLRASAAKALPKAVAGVSAETSIVHLSAAISLQEVVGQLLTEYALSQPTVRVRAVFGASNELADHVLAGAPCDVFLSADAVHVERLAAEKLIQPGSRRIVAANTLVCIGPRTGTLKVRKAEDLLSSQVEHVALADPESPLGKCSRAYLTDLGCYDQLLPKVIHMDNSRTLLSAVRSGRSVAGLAFASDAAKATDCKVLFTIDPDEASLEYSAAVLRGPGAKSGRAVLDFFASPAARREFRRHGLALPD